MTGWISIDRSIQNHWLFKEKRTFSKFEAWIYLLMEANHSQGKVTIGNQIVTVERGQRLTSILTLSDLFNWSRYKVKTFLDLLEGDGMLKVKTTTKYTLITIVNYDFYQSDEGRKKHQNDTNPTSVQHHSNINPTSVQHQTNTNNNDNKENNENNDNNVVVGDGFGTVYNLYQKNIEQIPSPITTEKLSQDVDMYGQALVSYAIEKAALTNSHNYKFIDYLLKDWRKRNLTTKEAVEQYEHQRQSQKQQSYKPKHQHSREKTPDWLTNRNQAKEEVVDPELEKARLEFERQLERDWADD